MPINKPTIAHQLKTVKIAKPKPTSVIHTNSNIVATTPHTRSHLRGGGPQWRKSSYERREDVVESGEISHSELKQCTRILRNVLANEENKSTSTDDCPLDDKFRNTTLVGSQTPDLSDSTERKNCLDKLQVSEDLGDEVTEADSLSSIVEPKPILTNSTGSSQHCSYNKILAPLPVFCICKSQTNKMHESRRLSVPGDGARVMSDKASVCARCHNIIPQYGYPDNDGLHNNNPDLTSGYDRFVEKCATKPYAANPSAEYNPPVHYDSVGDDKIDNIPGYLHIKLNEIGLIARTTRDADLDRLVSEIAYGFKQMVQDDTLLINHLKTITKTLKWDNSSLKQKIKIQSETHRDLKSEIKLLRQEQKQKVDELTVEIQLKDEELRQATEKDKNNTSHWNDKYHSLEKEYEKLRCEFQAQVLQACQKDTEIIQLRHNCAQSESKLKEQMHSLVLSKQSLQGELVKAQEVNKKYDQECQHNQSIIKAAREHVINLLDRHKQGRDGSSSVGYRFDSVCETPQNGSGDWINQATSLQQVLSMVSESRDGPRMPSNDHGSSVTPSNNYYQAPSQQYDQSRSMTISPINFATTNYNNNYVSSSTCNPNISEPSKRFTDNDMVPLKLSNTYQDSRSVTRSPSDISSIISRNSFDYSNKRFQGNVPNEIDDHNNNKFHDRFDITSMHDSWDLTVPKAKMSSASSVLSTVSSLRSTDDLDFRSGLQRLDTQISKLQTTLQSKLVCK